MSETARYVHSAIDQPAPQVLLAQTDLRPPIVADADDVLALVRRSGRLDVNSPYAYLLWFRDFPATSVVAILDGRLIGFVTGYLRPDAPDTYFAWQSAVDDAVSVPGLAFAMMTNVVERARALGARQFETTVNSDNRAVVMLIRKLARSYGAVPEVSVLFDDSHLGPDHDDEILYRFPLEDTSEPRKTAP